MKIIDFVVLGIILILASVVLYKIIKKRKNGGGCSCGCSSSKGCSGCNMKR